MLFSDAHNSASGQASKSSLERENILPKIILTQINRRTRKLKNENTSKVKQSGLWFLYSALIVNVLSYIA